MQRISRELHDGICQALMAIKLDLTLVRRRMPEELRGTVNDIRAQVIDVVQGIRQMSHLMHPPVLDDFGVVAAIESVAEKYRATSELEIRVTAPDPTIRCAAPISPIPRPPTASARSRSGSTRRRSSRSTRSARS